MKRVHKNWLSIEHNVTEHPHGSDASGLGCFRAAFGAAKVAFGADMNYCVHEEIRKQGLCQVDVPTIGLVFLGTKLFCSSLDKNKPIY